MATTKSHKSSLTPQKELAITVLLAGKTDQEAATAAGVARETICRWRSSCPFFEAELNRRRAEIWVCHKMSLQALVGDAIKTIAEAVKTDPKFAMQILQTCKGLNEIEPPTAPTTVEGILRRVAGERAQEELTEMRRKEGTEQLLFANPFEEARQVAPLIRKHYSALKKEYGLV